MTTSIKEAAPGVFDVRVVAGGKHNPPHYFRVRGTRLDAETAAAKWISKVGVRPSSLHPNCTLGAWLDYVLATRHDLSPRSRETYRTHLDNWINPPRPKPRPANWWSIGETRLRDITADHHGAFIVRAIDGDPDANPYRARRTGEPRRGVSARTMRDSLVLIRAGLTRAVEAGMIPVNPWVGTKLPRAKRRPPATPGRNDLSQLSLCPQPRVRLLLMLAAYTGARRGELLGLTWEQVDLRDGNLTIGASLEHTHGDLPTLKEPKTLSGRRTIKLPDVALAELRLARLAANREAVNTGRHIATVPVFANDDGSWWPPEAATIAARRAMAKLGVPGSLHTLRHAHATLLLGSEGSVSPHVVSRRLGHSTVRTTLDLYAHAIPADDNAAAVAIDRILAKAIGQEKGRTG
jgi:integrase